MNNYHVWITVAIIAAVTSAIRFLPFLLFSHKGKTPPIIDKLGEALPYAVMGMLVVYCLKDVSFSHVSGIVPPLAATLVTAISYVKKRNTLISILLGTVCYMVLIRITML